VTTNTYQRDLEIQIGDGEAPEGQDVEAVGVEIDADAFEQHGGEAQPAERRQEGEGQRHAREIGGDAAEGHQRRPQPRRKAALERNERKPEPDQRAENAGGGADLKAQPIGQADRRLV
jgi:hypothetical protein